MVRVVYMFDLLMCYFGLNGCSFVVFIFSGVCVILVVMSI